MDWRNSSGSLCRSNSSGFGVSGDGVEQDDFVTAKGLGLAETGDPLAVPPIAPIGFDLDPPGAIRADAFTFEGSGIPYSKFPQNPGG